MSRLYPRDLRLLARLARMRSTRLAALAERRERMKGPRGCRAKSGMETARPSLVVLCGPSQAGKSTFARAWRQMSVVVSSDEIRRRVTGRCAPCDRDARVWDAFERLKRKALATGRDVVLDACHVSRGARRHALEGPSERHLKACVVFDVPLKTVLARCRRSKRVYGTEVKRMWRAFQREKPGYRTLMEEGFDFVAIVRR